MHQRLLVGALITALSSAALADSFDINLNNHAVQATYAANLRTAEFDVGWISNNDKDSWVASLGLLAIGQKQTQDLRSEIGIGGKVYVVSIGDADIRALGLGGQVRAFPNNGPIGLGAYLFYAPDVVTSGDGKNFWEGGVSVEAEVVKNTASIYIGYRKVRTEIENGPHVTVDSGGHAGLRISF